MNDRECSFLENIDLAACLFVINLVVMMLLSLEM